jgi:hypothetical protein
LDAGGVIPTGISIFGGIDERTVDDEPPGGRPVRERTRPLPYCFRKMAMALISRSRIANIFSKRAR